MTQADLRASHREQGATEIVTQVSLSQLRLRPGMKRRTYHATLAGEGGNVVVHAGDFASGEQRHAPGLPVETRSAMQAEHVLLVRHCGDEVLPDQRDVHGGVTGAAAVVWPA